MIEGILFDMDGVLVDSEDVMARAAVIALRDYGAECSEEDFRPFRGGGEDRYIGGVAEQYGIPYRTEMKDRAYDVYDEIAAEEIVLYDRTPEVIAELRRRGFRLAVCSSADRRKVLTNLNASGIDAGNFEAILTGSEVAKKKPAPDLFLLGAEQLGLAPEVCLVVEDALNGIQAGKAAGCRVAAVTTSFPREQLERENPDEIIDALPELLDILKKGE